jgi:branched-chain amino acid transport system ATP-binding protein
MSSEAQSGGPDPTAESADGTRAFDPDDGALVVDSLTKRFGGLTAVDDLSFAVEEREILGFIGPNGAGKSTTFNCITGRYPPTEGTVYYRGEDVTGLPAYEMVGKGLARTFQEFRPFEDRTVLANVQTALVPDRLFSTRGLRGETRTEAIELCERVGLAEEMYRMPAELPHAGMLRLELARAMATDPDMLLVDEPFAGLADNEIGRVSTLLEELREEGTTLVVVDHNMRGLLELIDRAIVINFGELLAEGTPEEIRENPEVQKAYLGGESA